MRDVSIRGMRTATLCPLGRASFMLGHAERAVDLDAGVGNLAQVRDAFLPELAHQLLLGEELGAHVAPQQPAVPHHRQRGR